MSPVSEGRVIVSAREHFLWREWCDSRTREETLEKSYQVFLRAIAFKNFKFVLASAVFNIKFLRGFARKKPYSISQKSNHVMTMLQKT